MPEIKIEFELDSRHAVLFAEMAECFDTNHNEFAHLLVIRGMFELTHQLSAAMWDKLRLSAERHRDKRSEQQKLWEKLRADPKEGPFSDHN